MIKLLDRWIGTAGRCWVCGSETSSVYITTWIFAASVRFRRPRERNEAERTDLLAYAPLCLDCFRLFPQDWKRPCYTGNLDALLKEFPLETHGFEPETEVQERGSEDDLLEILAVPKGTASPVVRSAVVATSGRRAREARGKAKEGAERAQAVLPGLVALMPPRVTR